MLHIYKIKIITMSGLFSENITNDKKKLTYSYKNKKQQNIMWPWRFIIFDIC